MHYFKIKIAVQAKLDLDPDENYKEHDIICNVKASSEEDACLEVAKAISKLVQHKTLSDKRVHEGI